MAQQRGGMFTEGEMFGRGLRREPLLLAENRENVVGAKKIFAHRMRLDVIGYGHLGILAQPWNARLGLLEVTPLILLWGSELQLRLQIAWPSLGSVDPGLQPRARSAPEETLPSPLYPPMWQALLTGAIQNQGVESVAITWAAMASPRPTASTPSLVLAFRWIFSTGTLKDFASASRIFGKCGPSLGRSRITTASTYSMAKCFSSRSFRACSRNSRLLEPFHLGSLSGKCVPISPSPAAPNSASQSACATTSPSECPTGPFSHGTSIPPTISLRPSARRCRSYPMPQRTLMLFSALREDKTAPIPCPRAS